MGRKGNAMEYNQLMPGLMAEKIHQGWVVEGDRPRAVGKGIPDFDRQRKEGSQGLISLFSLRS